MLQTPNPCSMYAFTLVPSGLPYERTAEDRMVDDSDLVTNGRTVLLLKLQQRRCGVGRIESSKRAPKVWQVRIGREMFAIDSKVRQTSEYFARRPERVGSSKRPTGSCLQFWTATGIRTVYKTLAEQAGPGIGRGLHSRRDFCEMRPLPSLPGTANTCRVQPGRPRPPRLNARLPIPAAPTCW